MPGPYTTGRVKIIASRITQENRFLESFQIGRLFIMLRFELHPITPQVRLIKKVVEVFEEGGIVIYPTDSGYSMGCHARHKQAIQRLYQLKRNLKKYVMALMFHEFASITEFAIVENAAYRYMKNRLPGPYTFILPANKQGKKILEVKRPEIGVRMPQHVFFDSLHQISTEPILNTAARVKDEDFYIDPDDIAEAFEHFVDLLVDMGPIQRNPTTVISLVSGIPEVLREGAGR